MWRSSSRGKPEPVATLSSPHSQSILCTAAGGRQRPQRLHLLHEGHALKLAIREVASLWQRLDLVRPPGNYKTREREESRWRVRVRFVRAGYWLWLAPERTTNSRRSLSTVCRLMLCSCVLTLKPCKDAKHGGEMLWVHCNTYCTHIGGSIWTANAIHLPTLDIRSCSFVEAL